MSTSANEPMVQGDEGAVEPSGTDDAQTSEDRSSGLYDQYLERFPESLRPIATDVFKEWDAQTTKRFQDLHSEYEPWKPIAEEFEPEAVAQAIAIAQALESNPQGFYEALAQAYGFQQAAQAQQEQGVAGQELGEIDDQAGQYQTDPRLEQLEQAMQTMAAIMLQEREQQTFAQQDAELDQVLTSLKSQHGDFDEDYVLTKIAQGIAPDQAIAQYNAAVEQALAARNRPAAPTVMGAGGGLPTNQSSVTQLSSKDTQALVAKMLEQQAQQSR